MLGGEFLAERFPGITKTVTENGFDWGRDPIPVTPAAHYWMGGIRTDTFGRTTLPGLYAVGEASCTGVHGANRLASNSLLESLVFAWRAAAALDQPERPLRLDDLASVELVKSVASTGSAVSAGGQPFDRAAFQALMWSQVGLERDAAGLRAALARLEAWTVHGDTVDDWEDRAMLELGRLVARAALHREESRGAHARRDFPEPREELAHSVAWRKEPVGQTESVEPVETVVSTGSTAEALGVVS